MMRISVSKRRREENCLCYISFCCYLFSSLDISPTTGDFLRDPLVTNEDKYWTQMAGMLQFEHNLNTLTLFSESLDYQGTIIYQAGAEQWQPILANPRIGLCAHVNTANCSQLCFPNVRYFIQTGPVRIFEV